jgi:hypothetical protein
MGRQKKQVDEELPKKAPSLTSVMESVLAEVDLEYGVGVLVSGQDIIDKKPQVIPLSPTLESILGGGMEFLRVLG